ncbi:MAG: hypothetical protein VX764_09230 [Planctomycetota bacterium]|nr:hypothetical protein [Planctomycetota bacterium]
MSTLLSAAADASEVVSDGAVPVFGEVSIWVLIPFVILVLWLALKVVVAMGVFVPSSSNTRREVSGTRVEPVVTHGGVEPNLPNDFGALVNLIGHEVKCAEETMQLRAERLSRLIGHAEVVISQFQSHRTVSVQGESVFIQDLVGIPHLDSSLSVVDGRSDEEKTIQSKIEDLVACGTDPQQISEMTGRPIGEILVISRLIQRKYHQST